MSGYKQIKLSVGKAKAQKLASLKPVNLTATELQGTTDTLYLHPANYAIVSKAKRAGRGCRIQMASGEIMHDIEELQGGSIFSWLKDKAYPWLKKNWNIIKPVASALADVAIPAAATFFGAPQAAAPARMGLKTFAGVGMPQGGAPKGGRLVKGSQAAKDHMARIRAMRNGGGSFTLK